LAATPDETVIAKPVRCAHCQAALAEADHVLHGRYNKIDLPQVAPVVTRVERYMGRCRCCGGTTLAPVPESLEPGTPFSVGIVALAMYLRFVHAISYQRLSRLLLELFGLAISEGALDAVNGAPTLVGPNIRSGGPVAGWRRTMASLRPLLWGGA